MSLESYRCDMEGCSRCSSCKWIPLAQIRSQRWSQVCPSVWHNDFHAYSGSGKLNVALSILDGRSDFDESAADIFYACTMCGGCDVGCKVYRNDIDLTDTFHEARARAVELGFARLEHLQLVENMRAENNVFGLPRDERADWAADTSLLDANSEQVDILFHVGCRFSYDESQRDDLLAAVEILRTTGKRVGTSGTAEACCGQRAYECGFDSELHNFGDDMVNRVRTSGASMVAVACSDCFGAFNYLYPRNGKDLGVPVRHISEIAAELAADGSLVGAFSTPNATAAARPRVVTYHDPCHLGRRGEDYAGEFDGPKIDRPDNTRRDGRGGRYDAPRDVLKSLPGVTFVEMQRVREFSWCCGAGGGCAEGSESFSIAVATERLEEALSTGADTLATSCPWCVTNFTSAREQMRADGDHREIEIIGISELAARQISGEVPVTITTTATTCEEAAT
ncbi:MAG: (Fe-S)-binding protein [Microthrixaceae bacterium]|nr:(Fe-S)-binding protein [Microthrixaceae bacterium]